MPRNTLQASGNLVGLILAVLSDESLHGYGIAREIERRSENALTFGEGTLYPALKHLESQGHVVGHWRTPEGPGPARKVYEITPQGQQELVRIRTAWAEYSRSIDSVFGGHPEPITP